MLAITLANLIIPFVRVYLLTRCLSCLLASLLSQTGLAKLLGIDVGVPEESSHSTQRVRGNFFQSLNWIIKLLFLVTVAATFGYEGWQQSDFADGHISSGAYLEEQTWQQGSFSNDFQTSYEKLSFFGKLSQKIGWFQSMVSTKQTETVWSQIQQTGYEFNTFKVQTTQSKNQQLISAFTIIRPSLWGNRHLLWRISQAMSTLFVALYFYDWCCRYIEKDRVVRQKNRLPQFNWMTYFAVGTFLSSCLLSSSLNGLMLFILGVMLVLLHYAQKNIIYLRVALLVIGVMGAVRWMKWMVNIDWKVQTDGYGTNTIDIASIFSGIGERMSYLWDNTATRWISQLSDSKIQLNSIIQESQQWTNKLFASSTSSCHPLVYLLSVLPCLLYIPCSLSAQNQQQQQNTNLLFIEPLLDAAIWMHMFACLQGWGLGVEMGMEVIGVVVAGGVMLATRKRRSS